MKTANDIITFIGADIVADKIGITENAIRVRLATGKLPASWYDTLERIAGRPLPRDVFTFK